MEVRTTDVILKELAFTADKKLMKMKKYGPIVYTETARKIKDTVSCA